MIKLNNTVQPDPDVVVTELDDNETVLLHMGTKKYYTLNETGSRIWQLLSEGHTIGEACETMRNVYDILSSAVQKSILNLIRELIAENLMRVVEE
jgi:hypothetical protein